MTDSEKEAVIRRILTVWKRMPELRLGQLLLNSVGFWSGGRDIFYIEDHELAENTEKFLDHYGGENADK